MRLVKRTVAARVGKRFLFLFAGCLLAPSDGPPLIIGAEPVVAIKAKKKTKRTAARE